MDHTLLPMLAVQGTEPDHYQSDAWVAEGKLDGWRLIVHKTSDDKIRLWGGRNGSEYTSQVPYLETALAKILTPDTVVDGELLSPAGHGAIQSSMTTLGPHVPSLALPALTYVMFDVLKVTGTDVRRESWTRRRRLLDAIGITDHPLIRKSLILPTGIALEVALDAGLEGVVYKRRDSTYLNAKSSNWQKIKPQSTLDARVVGFKPGEGSFTGLVGALEFEILESGIRSRCSGFDRALRDEITAHQEEWLGRIIEVKHHGISKDGKPRHPQFLRVRPDRDQSEVFDASSIEADPMSYQRNEASRRPVSTLTQVALQDTPLEHLVPRPRRASQRPGMRNYKAMKREKLARCVRELEAGAGDAYERVLARQGDPAEDLRVAKAELEARTS